MKPVKLDWGYYYDIINCPDHIADNIHEYQMAFDKWLFDRKNDHGLWRTRSDADTPVSPLLGFGVCWGVNDLIDWLNENCIQEGDCDESVKLFEAQTPEQTRAELEKLIKKGVSRIYG